MGREEVTFNGFGVSGFVIMRLFHGDTIRFTFFHGTPDLNMHWLKNLYLKSTDPFWERQKKKKKKNS